MDLSDLSGVRYVEREIFSNAWPGPFYSLRPISLASFGLLTNHAAAIWVGMTEAELLQELGPPTAALAVGNR